ncbi:MAG: LamG domain-containing protein, partial [Lentisphaerae bacterium]|nr:LamG domain-containing protein [Lentisphaerota bacterium]
MLALVLVALGALGYDASSYVQSGLIAQWDGIDNAGLGFHYSDATVWKDLKGIYDLALTAKGSWGANFLQVANGCAANYGAKGPTDYLTIEVLYRQPAVLSRYGYLLNSGDKYHYVLIKEDGKTVFFNGSGGVDDIIAYDTLDGEIHAVAAVYSSATAVSAVYTNGVTATGAAGAASYNAGKGWLMLGDRELSATYPWSGEIYAIRLYSEALTPAQIATNHLVDSVRYLGATPDDLLAICASPINLDVTLSPGYAGRDGLAAGESLAVSAPAGEVTITDGFKATCTGWKLYDAAANVVDSGNGNSFTYVHPTPAAYRKLEWQFATAIRVTASGAGGTYTPAEQWVAFGSPASFTV